jgi:hypothetical protein
MASFFGCPQFVFPTPNVLAKGLPDPRKNQPAAHRRSLIPLLLALVPK